MCPPCAPPGTSPASRDRRDRRPAIDAACGHNRVPTQEEQHMEIAAAFRGDCGRVVSGVACQTPENARKFRHKACLAWRKRRAESVRPAIVATCGHDRVAAQNPEQMDITAVLRSDRCRVVLPKSLEFPGNSSKRSRTRKKSRIRASSGAKSLAKRRTPMSKTAHIAPKRGQNGGKWSQRSRGFRGWSPGEPGSNTLSFSLARPIGRIADTPFIADLHHEVAPCRRVSPESGRPCSLP